MLALLQLKNKAVAMLRNFRHNQKIAGTTLDLLFIFMCLGKGIQGGRYEEIFSKDHKDSYDYNYNDIDNHDYYINILFLFFYLPIFT